MTFMRMVLNPVAVGTRTAVLATLLALSAAPAMAQDQPAATPAPAPAPAPQAAAPSVPQPDWEKVCGPINNQQECHTSRKRLAATGQPIAQFLVIERGDK